MLLLALVTAFTLTNCAEDNDSYFSAGEDDFPRILNTDIPETSGGEPSPLPAIYRNNNFHFEVVVTPVHYTTVTWFIDGENVYEGNTIDMPLLAGDYSVKIVATTTRGKQTWRNCTLSVLPLDGDPVLADDVKSRWMNPGTKVTINGENLDGITGMTIGGVPVTDFVNNGSSLTFTVPELADGDYQMVVESASGRFGCGKTKVTVEKYREPGVVEVTLWEGETDINWGESNVLISAETMADIPVGTNIKFYYEMIDAEYHAMRITTPSWGDNPEDNLVCQFDVTADTPVPFEFVYDEACKALVDGRGGMLIVGFGYKLTKVAYDKSAATVEKTLWEGSNVINWGESNVNITPDQMADVPVGTKIRLYYNVPDAEYHAMRITTPSWGDNPEDNLVCQFDVTPDTPNPYEFIYTADCKKLVDGRGGMLIVGFGYELTKVTYEVAGGGAEVVFDGSQDINWGEANLSLSLPDLGITAGKTLTIDYVLCDMPEGYHCAKVVTGPSWVHQDILDQFDLTEDGSYELKVTDEMVSKAAEDGNAFLLVGYGYTIKKVSMK